MHVPGDPLVLYNAWDAGSAKAIERAGARAIATSSWAMAAAAGFEDGEQLPLQEALRAISRIVDSVSIPVTADFEGGYAAAASEIERNVAQLVNLGVAGLNFEDQVVGGKGIYSVGEQAKRIRAVRSAGDRAGVRLLINARSDLFFKAGPGAEPATLIDEALERASAYRDAGSDCLFFPGLEDHAVVELLCSEAGLPINLMVLSDKPDIKSLARLGVSRVSLGPAPYLRHLADIEAGVGILT